VSTDINKVIIIGRLTRDPELKTTQGGTSVCGFSIASNFSYGSGDAKKETVSFFNCVAWAKSGEIIAQYQHKGDRVCIMGRLQQRSWDDAEGKKRQTVEIVVDGFQFLSQKKSTDEQPRHTDEPAPDNPFSDDDIQF